MLIGFKVVDLGGTANFSHNVCRVQPPGAARAARLCQALRYFTRVWGLGFRVWASAFVAALLWYRTFRFHSSNRIFRSPNEER